jgi:hypothetical protein
VPDPEGMTVQSSSFVTLSANFSLSVRMLESKTLLPPYLYFALDSDTAGERATVQTGINEIYILILTLYVLMANSAS